MNLKNIAKKLDVFSTRPKFLFRKKEFISS
jgi:hypothetical protein